jgi:hypothetical protein
MCERILKCKKVTERQYRGRSIELTFAEQVYVQHRVSSQCFLEECESKILTKCRFSWKHYWDRCHEWTRAIFCSHACRILPDLACLDMHDSARDAQHTPRPSASSSIRSTNDCSCQDEQYEFFWESVR